jgi:putative resolvase
VTVIVVERRDGFARFGAGCVEAALPARGRGLLAAGPSEVDGNLVRDAAEILTSPCSRRRAAGSHAARAVAALGREAPG